MKKYYDSLRNPRGRNKIIPPAVVGAAIVGVAFAAFGTPGNSEKARPIVSPESELAPSDVFTGTSEFGGSESGWGQGAAERAIRNALEKGIPAVLDQSMTKAEVEDVIRTLPIYEQAGDVLEIAYSHDKDAMPDVGDELKAQVKVETDEHGISYRVVDGEIIDLPNNQ